MARYMWVDKRGAGRGAVVFGLGLVLLLFTPVDAAMVEGRASAAAEPGAAPNG